MQKTVYVTHKQFIQSTYDTDGSYQISVDEQQTDSSSLASINGVHFALSVDADTFAKTKIGDAFVVSLTPGMAAVHPEAVPVVDAIIAKMEGRNPNGALAQVAEQTQDAAAKANQ